MIFENATLGAIADAVRKNTERMLEQDRLDELYRPTADHFHEAVYHGEFNEAGATLSHADFEDARANL